jgi:hypothetical protein
MEIERGCRERERVKGRGEREGKEVQIFKERNRERVGDREGEGYMK